MFKHILLATMVLLHPNTPPNWRWGLRARMAQS